MLRRDCVQHIVVGPVVPRHHRVLCTFVCTFAALTRRGIDSHETIRPVASPSHAMLRSGEWYPLFIGRFTSKLDLDIYMTDKFPANFGFVIDPPSGPAHDVRADPLTPIEYLINGFSESERFATSRASPADGWLDTRSGDGGLLPSRLRSEAVRKFNNFGPLKFARTFDFVSKALTP